MTEVGIYVNQQINGQIEKITNKNTGELMEKFE